MSEAEDDEAAPAGEEIADADDDARRVGQLLAGAEQPREDRLELRDDDDHDDGDSANRHQHDGRRVDHRRDDVLLELDDLLDEGREALENQVQDAARLAGLDHVRVELVEDLRVARHRRRQGRALLHVLPHLLQGLLEVFVLLLLRQNVQALHEGQAGVNHHGELAREDGEVLGLDSLRPADLGDADLAPLLLDGRERDLLAAQDLAQRLAVLRDALADDDLVEPVAAFEDVSGHGP